MKVNISRILSLGLLVLFLGETLVAKEALSLQRSPELLAYCYEVWSRSGFGQAPNKVEVAAWIIRKEEGYGRWDWPACNKRSKQIWCRTKPYAAVAIVHTHPANMDPRPSSADTLLSRKINTVIYTISRKGIWKVQPDGLVTCEAGPEWYKDVDQQIVPSK